MPRQYKPEEIGENFVENLKDFLNSQKSGSFFCIHEYRNIQGEVATHWAQFGVNYGNIVKKSIQIVDRWLTALEAGETPAGIPNIQIRYKTHVGDDGESSKASKTRIPVEKTITNPSDEQIVIALRSILADLTKPADEKKQGADYQKEAKGLFSLERADGRYLLYIRDCLTIGKYVHEKGTYDDDKGFTTGEQALKKALRAKLPVGKYRTYKFVVNAEEGEGFTSLVLGGNAIMVGDAMAGEIWSTLPEWAKELVVNPAAAEILDEAAAELRQAVAALG